MLLKRAVLTEYLSNLLDISAFKDYCPNGLQVEGTDTISKILFGVTACQELIDVAVEQKVDALIVHHGLFWHGDPQVVTGITKKRLKSLLDNNINLYAYHLPLDCHQVLGNNAQIGKRLSLSNISSHKVGKVDNLLWSADLSHVQTVNAFQDSLASLFERQPLYLGNGAEQEIKRIAWCSGAAQKYIAKAKSLGADLYFSGEVSEQTQSLAKEYDIHYLGCGHNATERFGVGALRMHLESVYTVQCASFYVENPV